MIPVPSLYEHKNRHIRSPHLIEITLTASEIRMAATVGIERQMSALKRNLKNANGYNGKDVWDKHIKGALGELAVAKHLGVFYRGDVDTFKKPDVGAFQIRYTQMDPPALIIRPGDNDDEKFICVTGDAPTLQVHGWILAKEGKNKKWSKAPNGRPPAYFIPLDQLHPMETIIEEEEPCGLKLVMP